MWVWVPLTSTCFLALACAKTDDTEISTAPAQEVGIPRWLQWQRIRLPIQRPGDRGLIPGLGRPPEKEMAASSSSLAGKIL